MIRTDLKTWRVNKGLSLREASHQMRIGTMTLARAEAGQPVRPSTALAIARFYGYAVTDIWPVDDHDRSAA